MDVNKGWDIMIYKNGKIFGKISILDLVIIFLVVGAGLFAANRFGLFSSKELGTTINNLKVVFYQEEVNSFTANNVNLGDPTTETLQNISLGTVVNIEKADSVSWGKDQNGKQIKSTKTGWSSIYITMETNGLLGPNGIVIGGSTYYIGQFITLRVGDSIFYGRIFSAEKI